MFDATDPKSDVQRITYRVRGPDTVDVTANRTDEQGPYLVEFTLRRSQTGGRPPAARNL